LTDAESIAIIDIKPTGVIAYVQVYVYTYVLAQCVYIYIYIYSAFPFKALDSRPTSQPLPFPLKPFKLRRYLVYMAYLRKMYNIVYISQYPPMAACPPPEVFWDFKVFQRFQRILTHTTQAMTH